jgi:beta-glucanase (GH16 family)
MSTACSQDAIADLPAGKTWVFDHPFFILLNVAVGGSFPGNPDATTVFPQQLQVDYVRVYQRSTPSSIPVLFSDEGSNRGLALDSVTFKRDPFPADNRLNFSSDHQVDVAGANVICSQVTIRNGHCRRDDAEDTIIHSRWNG